MHTSALRLAREAQLLHSLVHELAAGVIQRGRKRQARRALLSMKQKKTHGKKKPQI